MNATPKENRDYWFYRDAFTEASNWGPGIFEAQCAEKGIVPEEDEFFGQTAFRLWESMTEEEQNEFASDYDDWLDA